jgi:hypothetical protein
MRLFLILTFLLLTSTVFAMDIKNSDLAGSWYPRDKAQLSKLLEGYLKLARAEKIDGDIFAIISPHAGYQFSGPVAAYGYKAVQGKNIKTVIIIGFSHRKYFDGISVYAKGLWRTPLGDVAINETIASELVAQNKRMHFERGLFDDENSVEMQIPFVQLALKDAKIVPIILGTQDYGDAEILADALSEVLKERRDYLIVASTDLSHYHSYAEANTIDKNLMTVLAGMKAKELYADAVNGTCELCGMMPVTATLLAAEKLGFKDIKILKYANSGDTFGDKSKVVGYLSASIFRGQGSILNDAQRERLLQIAKESITSYVKDGKRKKFSESDPLLSEKMGAFVTLHENGQLRGCIGNMVGSGPLFKTIADMAIEAATGDPRFPVLSAGELNKIDIEISVLTPLRKVTSYKDVKIPGDGVLIRSGFHSGVFLPQVATETGWDRDKFLTYLCSEKAGLAPEAWKDPKTEIYVFSAEVFKEKKSAGSE